MVAYDSLIFNNDENVQAWITQYGLDIVQSMPPLKIANRWWAPYAYVAPQSAPILKIPFNLTVPRMSDYTGRDNMQRGTTSGSRSGATSREPSGSSRTSSASGRVTSACSRSIRP